MYSINIMQGKSNHSVDEVYFLEDTEKLRKDYIKYLPSLLIFSEVNQLNIKSPEFVKLENENTTLKSELSKMDDIMERLTKLERG